MEIILVCLTKKFPAELTCCLPNWEKKNKHSQGPYVLMNIERT